MATRPNPVLASIKLPVDFFFFFFCSAKQNFLSLPINFLPKKKKKKLKSKKKNFLCKVFEVIKSEYAKVFIRFYLSVFLFSFFFFVKMKYINIVLLTDMC